MHLGELAATSANKAAYVIAETGVTTTFAQLDDLSMQASQLFRQLGLNRGDHVAILLENHPALLQICFAAQRSGLYFTAISYRLQEEEVDYIVSDCQAKAFITSKSQQHLVEKLSLDHCHSFMVDGVAAGFNSWEESLAEMPAEKIADESIGVQMLYSSGTTGRPKGV
ncbi:MAG: AMP-binding protein, partial [Gammaproteobacteria bacterium]|nr:AMP-binding protein [Gammaproteobacteria bacterium]